MRLSRPIGAGVITAADGCALRARTAGMPDTRIGRNPCRSGIRLWTDVRPTRSDTGSEAYFAYPVCFIRRGSLIRTVSDRPGRSLRLPGCASADEHAHTIYRYSMQYSQISPEQSAKLPIETITPPLSSIRHRNGVKRTCAGTPVSMRYLRHLSETDHAASCVPPTRRACCRGRNLAPIDRRCDH